MSPFLSSPNRRASKRKHAIVKRLRRLSSGLLRLSQLNSNISLPGTRGKIKYPFPPSSTMCRESSRLYLRRLDLIHQESECWKQDGHSSGLPWLSQLNSNISLPGTGGKINYPFPPSSTMCRELSRLYLRCLDLIHHQESECRKGLIQLLPSYPFPTYIGRKICVLGGKNTY